MLIRFASPEDVSRIDDLASRSVSGLHTGHYPASVIAAAVAHAYGADWQLIADHTYLVAEADGVLVGAGGWSWRETIAGSHGPDSPPGTPLDPRTDPARVRAFYVDPDFAGRGIGAALLERCEGAAVAAGFSKATLTSTLFAVPFYEKHGYNRVGPYRMPLPGGMVLELVCMDKRLAAPSKVAGATANG